MRASQTLESCQKKCVGAERKEREGQLLDQDESVSMVAAKVVGGRARATQHEFIFG